jgi:hypothetical protein
MIHKTQPALPMNHSMGTPSREMLAMFVCSSSLSPISKTSGVQRHPRYPSASDGKQRVMREPSERGEDGGRVLTINTPPSPSQTTPAHRRRPPTRQDGPTGLEGQLRQPCAAGLSCPDSHGNGVVAAVPAYCVVQEFFGHRERHVADVPTEFCARCSVSIFAPHCA